MENQLAMTISHSEEKPGDVEKLYRIQRVLYAKFAPTTTDKQRRQSYWIQRALKLMRQVEWAAKFRAQGKEQLSQLLLQEVPLWAKQGGPLHPISDPCSRQI